MFVNDPVPNAMQSHNPKLHNPYPCHFEHIHVANVLDKDTAAEVALLFVWRKKHGKEVVLIQYLYWDLEKYILDTDSNQIW